MTDHAPGCFDLLREVRCGYGTEQSTTVALIHRHGPGPRISRMETYGRGRSRRVLSVPIRVIRGQNQSGSNQSRQATAAPARGSALLVM